MTGWQYADVWDVIAEVRGDSPALVHGDRRVSWRELSARADGLAASLVQGGAGKGDRVVQYLYNGPEYLEVSYGAYKAALTPVNTNYRYRADELVFLWDNADAVAVVFHGAFSETVSSVRDRVPSVRRWIWVDDDTSPCPPWAEPYEQLTAGGSPGRFEPPWGRSGDDIVMIYTGGTTGTPKGVMWRHDDMYRAFAVTGDPTQPDLAHVRTRLAAAPGPGPGPVGLPASPLMHATGYMFAKSMLTQGGTVVTLPSRHFDADGLLDAVDRHRVQAMAIVGDSFARPIVAALDAAPGRWDLASLQMVVSAGVMWSAETKVALAAYMPGAMLIDVLGSTEAHGLGSAIGAGAAATATFTLGSHAMVVTDDGRRAGPGEEGLLAVRGPIPLGYHKDTDKTAATFRQVDGERVSIPGDWARVEPDGTITLLGRGSLCINTGGEKVFPEEVEEVLKSHAAVRDSTVVGLPDVRLGESVAAAVELEPGADASADDLIAHVRSRLAGYKAPRHLLIVDSLGRSPNGKADYHGTRERISKSLATQTQPSHR